VNRKIVSTVVLSLGLAGILTAGGCDEGGNPAPDSDSSFAYEDGATIPVDEKVYTVTGEVIGQVNALTRQVEPAKGSLSGSTYGSYGTVSGSFTGPIEAGKGFVRLKVNASDSELARPSEAVILKTADTKVTALQPGDIITFRCRAQYENIAAVKDGQKFEQAKVGTMELDYCRLETPLIQVR
jgi:hypothetical protein